MSAAAIETRGLGKRYGKVHALEGLSLRVEEGEVFGFLGPNGAGKTTTIRLLLGLLRPSEGDASILGQPVAPGGVTAHADLGYLAGEARFWPQLPGARTLDLLALLSKRPPVLREQLLARLGLGGDALKRPVRTYSDGMRQKLGIVQALQCAPKLALLDEPTKGLDPLVQQEFYAILADARRQGTTIFFSSHVLPEVERVCDRVAILRAGRLVSVSDVEQLKRAARRRVVVEFREDVDAAALAAFGEVAGTEARRVVLLVMREKLPALVARLGMMPLADLLIEQPSLEETFLEQYR
ncbi:MAG: ABC transporter ATP-binding protein [Gemmatimonadales bacterium]|nr:ABC transporter ATP-binding protein [Gemmatimonadales bacterium]